MQSLIIELCETSMCDFVYLLVASSSKVHLWNTAVCDDIGFVWEEGTLER